MQSSDKEKKAKMVSSIIYFISLATKVHWHGTFLVESAWEYKCKDGFEACHESCFINRLTNPPAMGWKC